MKAVPLQPGKWAGFLGLFVVFGCGGTIEVPAPDVGSPETHVDVGSDSTLEIGTEAAVDVALEVPDVPGDMADVAVGDNHSCALDTKGNVRCWGANGRGQLGRTTPPSSNRPLLVEGVSGATRVVAGGSFTCVLIAGEVWCWGQNASGELGDGSSVFQRAAPAKVAGLANVVAIGAGREHACAVLVDGSVRCWGSNSFGKLGGGTIGGTAGVTTVSGLSDVLSVAPGGAHTCARRKDGGVACWGQGGYGQLGNGTSSPDAPTPGAVPTLSGIVALASGYWWSCAAANDGTVFCWGANWFGQLGAPIDPKPLEDFRATPLKVATVSSIVGLGAGGGSTCAVRKDGTLMCWGHNAKGELGVGKSSGEGNYGVLPTLVSGLSDAVQVVVGHRHACARRSSGSVACWGANVAGQLGDSTTIDRYVPTTVVW